MNFLYLIADTAIGQIAGLGIVVILMLGLLIVTLKYGALWWEGYNCGAQIGLIELVIMGLRQVNQKAIMKAKIKAVQAQLKPERDLPKGASFDGTFVTTNSLEAHYLAGGNVGNIIEALVASKNAGIALEFDQAAAIDLAGRDVVEAVRTSVDPKVISCPDPQRSGKESLSAVAKDGVAPAALVEHLRSRKVYATHGTHYCPALWEALGSSTDVTRISFLHYNSCRDVERALEGLRTA